MLTMKTFRLFVLLIVTINNRLIQCDNYIDLGIDQGVLSGSVEKTLFKEVPFYSFKGIPFAEPPVNDLRFQPPVPHRGWEGILEAHENKPTCIQQNSKMRMGEQFGISGSEDCLYLNVFTASTNGALPVVIFDFNDDFRTGFNGTDTYSPDLFIEEGIVVVTISHRLGLFGYFTTEDDTIPPNLGLRDYILGLKWVKNNIDKFGGDPNKITLMGSRGGGVLVNMLLYSEKAKDLFNAVIIQSGTALEPTFYPKNLRRKSFELGKALGIETDDSKQLLKELQKINASDIIAREIDIINDDQFKSNQISSILFSPIVEKNNYDTVITSLPEESKIVNDVPVLIGYNSRNGLEMVSHYLYQPELMKALFNDFLFHFPIRVNFRFDNDILIYVVDEIKKLYFGDGNFDYNKIFDYSDYIGDIFVNYAANKTIRKITEDMQSPVYFYVFDFRGALNENSEYITRHSLNSAKYIGATIADELCYLHVCSRIKRKYFDLMNLPSEQPEIKVLKKMVKMWTNFIKTRNPTPNINQGVLKGINWKPLDKNNEPKYLHILKKITMKPFEVSERENFWNDFIAKYEKLAIDGVVNINKESFEYQSTNIDTKDSDNGNQNNDFLDEISNLFQEIDQAHENIKQENGTTEKIQVVDNPHTEL